MKSSFSSRPVETIDLTRQTSTDREKASHLIEQYVDDYLKKKIYSSFPSSASVLKKEDATGVVEELSRVFNEISNEKLKRLIEENASFVTVLLSNLSLVSFNESVLHSATFKEYSITLNLFSSIFFALKDSLFMVTETSAKDLFYTFTLICSSSLSLKTTSPSSSSSSSFMEYDKTISVFFRIISSLYLIIRSSSSVTELEEFERIKDKYYQLFSLILTALSRASEVFNRVISKALQDYLFWLPVEIIGDLLSQLHSFNRDKKTIHSSIIEEYNKLLTALCFHSEINLFPIIIQNILKSYAAICSFVLMKATSSASPLSVDLKSSSVLPSKKREATAALTVTVSPQKNTLSHYFPTIKSNDTTDIQIKKRSYDEFSSSSSNLQKSNDLSSQLFSLFNPQHDLISQFLSFLYQCLLKGNWNYDYTPPKSYEQLLKICIPFLFMTNHHSLRMISRHLLHLLFCCKENPSKFASIKASSLSSASILLSFEGLLSKEQLTLSMIFHTKSSLFSCYQLLEGIMMIVNDDLNQSHSDDDEDEEKLESERQPAKTGKKLLSLSFNEILECLLRYYVSYSPSNENERSAYEAFTALLDEFLSFLFLSDYTDFNNVVEGLLIQGKGKNLLNAVKLLILKEREQEMPLTKHSKDIPARSSNQHKIVPLSHFPSSSSSSKKKDDVLDLFASLEEEETKQNPRNLTEGQLKKRQRIYGVDDEIGEKDWMWIENDRNNQYPPRYDPSRGNSSHRVLPSTVKSHHSSSTYHQSSLISKAGVDVNWNQQMNELKKEKQSARQRVESAGVDKKRDSESRKEKPGKQLERQSSFITLDDEGVYHGVRRGNADAAEESKTETPVKKPVVLFNIHEYMKKEENNGSNTNNDDLPPDKDTLLLEEARKMFDMISRESLYHHTANYPDEEERIGESILSVSIDSICKEILNLHLTGLVSSELEPGEVKGGEDSSNPMSRSGSLHPSSTELKPLPIRFNTAEQYISLFQPLLVEEFKAALTSVLLNEDGSSSNNAANSYRYSSSGSDKEFREIYCKSEIIVIKSTDKELMETQIKLDMNHPQNQGLSVADGGKAGNNNNNNVQRRIMDLQKDELVLIVRGEHLPPSKSCFLLPFLGFR
jgi:hypothetical protein